MNKILSILLIGIGVVIGVNYFACEKAEESFEAAVASLKDTKNIKVLESSYDKGFFSSNANLKFEFYGQESMMDKNIKLGLQSTVQHSILSLFSGFKIHTDVKILDDDMAKILKDVLISDSLAKVETTVKIDKSQKSVVKFTDIDFKEGEESFKSKALSISFDTQDEVKLNFLEFAYEDLDLNMLVVEEGIENPVKFSSKNGKFSIEYENGIDLDNIDKFEIFPPQKGKYSIESLNFSGYEVSMSFNDLKSEDSAKFVGNDTKIADCAGVVTFKNLVVNNAKIKDVKLNASLKNVDIDAVNKINNFANNEQENNALIAQFFNKAGKFDVDELSFKNESGSSKIESNLHISSTGSLKDDLSNISETLVLNGKVQIDGTLSKFFEKNENIADLDALFNEIGLLKKVGEKSVCDLKFDNKEGDIIANDTLKIFENAPALVLNIAPYLF
ncbi:MAG: YdgA family protein [Campylobacter sp.]|nr:YdgA family protein [Campylobacter sp.]